MDGFDEININEELVVALKKQNILKPTQVQKEAIPLIMQGKDVIAQAETGSGKTLAYILPIFQKLNLEAKSVQAMILTPTHELAIQVERQINLLAKNSGIPVKVAVIIGNVNIARQIEKLKEKPQIVVGSCGRILELISKRKLTGHDVKTIIIDEADRMLDEKNIEGAKAVIKTTLKDRQILMFSATMSEKAVSTAETFMKQPEILRIKGRESLPDTIEHIYFVCEKRDKIELLRKIIRSQKPQRVIVFINNPNEIETTIEKLEYHKLQATGIYGLANKLERKKAMEDFTSGKKPILVSSDLGSRGLDIEGVTHVISMDIPEEPVFYLHRAGRTGRAGKKGCSISIVMPQEEQWLRKYEKQFGIKILLKDMSYGKISEKEKAEDKTGKPNNEKKSALSDKKNKIGYDMGKKNIGNASSKNASKEGNFQNKSNININSDKKKTKTDPYKNNGKNNLKSESVQKHSKNEGVAQGYIDNKSFCSNKLDLKKGTDKQGNKIRTKNEKGNTSAFFEKEESKTYTKPISENNDNDRKSKGLKKKYAIKKKK